MHHKYARRMIARLVGVGEGGGGACRLWLNGTWFLFFMCKTEHSLGLTRHTLLETCRQYYDMLITLSHYTRFSLLADTHQRTGWSANVYQLSMGWDNLLFIENLSYWLTSKIGGECFTFNVQGYVVLLAQLGTPRMDMQDSSINSLHCNTSRIYH